MTLRGVDAHNWQGAPADWRSLAGNIDWAAIKIAELGPDGEQSASSRSSRPGTARASADTRLYWWCPRILPVTDRNFV
jgi:hypothetical protein